MSTEAKSAASPLSLTHDDVERLLRDTSPATLIDITSKIAHVYNGKPLQPNESKAAEQIFRLLLRETELRVRVNLAEQVKNSRQIPRDIIFSLAHDVEEVALPILQFSEILNDEDLLELINNTEEISRYIAISSRQSVSDIISDTLLVVGNDTVAETLVSNPGASLSERGLQKIVDTYNTNEKMMEAVSNRPHLPVAVAEKLLMVVSSSLSETLTKKYKQPAKEIKLEVDKTREHETLFLARNTTSPEEIDKLVNQLYAFNRLTPSMILSALCQGNFAFFETSLARLSNIPTSNARTLISDRGELGFRAIYNKSGLPDAMFPAVRLLLKVVRELDKNGEKPGSSHYANRVVEEILQRSEKEPVENLSYIIALVRKES